MIWWGDAKNGKWLYASNAKRQTRQTANGFFSHVYSPEIKSIVIAPLGALIRTLRGLDVVSINETSRIFENYFRALTKLNLSLTFILLMTFSILINARLSHLLAVIVLCTPLFCFSKAKLKEINRISCLLNSTWAEQFNGSVQRINVKWNKHTQTQLCTY